MEKKRLWKLTALFFAGMILFTLLSRAAYQQGTAVVTTQAASGGVISHTVQITGKVVQNQELAVTTVGGLRVSEVPVNEGQQVAQGDVLFKLDLEYLEERIQEQKQEMRKQELSIQDAWSQVNASEQRRANSMAQAEENYNSAVSQAQTKVDRAEQALERAKEALEDFYNGMPVDQEEALNQLCQEAREAYAQAQTDLQTLEGEIQAAVDAAIAQAEQDLANQSTGGTGLTQQEKDQIGEQIRQSYAQQLYDAQLAVEQAGDQPEEAQAALDILEQQIQSEIDQAIAQAEQDLANQSAGGTGLTQQEKDQIEESVRQSYAQQLYDAQQKVEQTRQEAEAREEELEAYLQQMGEGQATEESLIAAVEQAQEAYDDAVTSLENAKTQYGRAIDSASLPESSNHSAQIGQITYDQMALDLEKLEALLESNGEILAPADGVVTQCYVQTGEKTTDTTAMLLADLSRGLKFSGVITQEQSEYIGVGDEVTLRAESTGKEYTDLTVTTVSTQEEAEGGYRLTVQLPAETLTLGSVVQMNCTRKSQPYNCCVPLSALHLDQWNQPYVLIVEQVNTVLGTQTQAQKISVQVLEQNEYMAALETGALNSEHQVIVGSDRAVDVGSRIRVS